MFGNVFSPELCWYIDIKYEKGNICYTEDDAMNSNVQGKPYLSFLDYTIFNVLYILNIKIQEFRD